MLDLEVKIELKLNYCKEDDCEIRNKIWDTHFLPEH